MLPALAGAQLDQQCPKVGERPTSLALQGIDLPESTVTAVLVSAEGLQLQEHHGESLGDAIVKLASEKRTQLFG